MPVAEGMRPETRAGAAQAPEVRAIRVFVRYLTCYSKARRQVKPTARYRHWVQDAARARGGDLTAYRQFCYERGKGCLLRLPHLERGLEPNFIRGGS